MTSLAFVNHPHIAPRPKKEYSYTTTSPQGFHGLFQGGLYHLCTVTREHFKCKSYYPLNDELNPICHLQALLGAHHILHVFRIMVKFRLFTKSQKNIKQYK